MHKDPGIEQYLNVGSAVTIQPLDKYLGRKRYRSQIRGWQRNEHIVLDIPSVEDRRLPLHVNKPCAVRFISRGNAIGFRSVVLKEGTARSPFVFVMWPEEFEVVRVRRHERVPVQIPCTLAKWDKQNLAAELRDISAGGCAVWCAETLSLGEPLKLSCSLPDGGAIEKAPLEVRSVHERGGGFLAGCEFVRCDAATSSTVQLFVTAMLEQFRQAAPVDSSGPVQ
jgi:c-di-GMP-binding flagellar brake protein YcgR